VIGIVLLLAVGAASMLLGAAVIAVILNLPLSGDVRFLLVVAALWALRIFWILSTIQSDQQKHMRFTRAAYIAIHLRNEQDELPPVKERLRVDEEREADGENITAWISIAMVAVTACFLGALLHFGVFGSFGAGWFHRGGR
jgi:hypothetical protein